MPTKPIGPPTETAAPVASEAAEERDALRAHDVHAARTRGLRADAEQVQRPRQPGEPANATSDQRQRASNRRVAGDVEIAHQPPQRAERLREVAEVLHEQDERREERVQRHARQQQHGRRDSAMLRRGQRVDDEHGEKRAKQAGRGDAADRPAWPNVIAIIAPSEAPAETPSVYGVASGLRSSPWNTTPAAASVPPTSAAASARGRRAIKKICASTLSANGIDRLKTRAKSIDVEPMNGAAKTATTIARKHNATTRPGFMRRLE